MPPSKFADPKVNAEALKSEIRSVGITQKANACPMLIRLAWHASGTFDKADGSGGSNGAGMRFEPEMTDDANAGLSIVRDMLLPVKHRHPEISHADIWVAAGCAAVEFLGGPKVAHEFGRTDAANGSGCPANGRLPDAAQGADHVRDVFSRMGFDDRETVALLGAHTLGRCHKVRSGYDGPWTRNPLRFDNAYYRNLLNLEWVPRQWDGPLQYEDKETGDLMMLPADLAMIQDPEYRVHVERYAKDQNAFFKDFAAAFSKLVSLGTTLDEDGNAPAAEEGRTMAGDEGPSAEFREWAMHGSLDAMKKIAAQANMNSVERSSGRTALHKAAFWGHDHVIKYLVDECRLDVSVKDFAGDTALHDAVRFGHEGVVKLLLGAGADPFAKNADGKDSIACAEEYEKPELVALLKEGVTPPVRSRL